MQSLKAVPDRDLLRWLSESVRKLRRNEADVVAQIGEVEARRAYLREAASSMFAYCTEVLHFSEPEAVLRIRVARATRRHPMLLTMLREGRLHLSGIALLAPLLTEENREVLLDRACHKSKRQIEEIVAELQPRPETPATVRRVPTRPGPAAGLAADPLCPETVGKPGALCPEAGAGPPVLCPDTVADPELDPEACRPPRAKPATIEAVGRKRYDVRFTASAELREKLERLQALMRSSVADGDLGRIIDIAITEKLERVEARRFAKTPKPRKSLAETDTRPSSRYIPAAVRRAVYERDGGRCTFRDENGRRCSRRDDVEYHHKHGFARGGQHSPANVTLLCRPHNSYLAELDYGKEVMARFRRSASGGAAPLDVYGDRIAVQARPRAPGC